MKMNHSNYILKNGQPSTATVGSVARRFHEEIGLPKRVSIRLSKKFNRLAKKVDWAVSLPDRSTSKPAKKSVKRASK
jgi:hypothetical protein